MCIVGSTLSYGCGCCRSATGSRECDDHISSSTHSNLVALHYHTIKQYDALFSSCVRAFFFFLSSVTVLYLKIVRRLISFRVRTYLFCGHYTFSRPRPHFFVVGARTSQLLFISFMHPPFTFYLPHFLLYTCLSLTCTQCSHGGSQFI